MGDGEDEEEEKGTSDATNMELHLGLAVGR